MKMEKKYSLGCFEGVAVSPSEGGVDGDHQPREAPAAQIKPLFQLFLRGESGDQQDVQIEALAEHPEIVGEQEIVESQV
jgi:hypothetical protein